MSTRKQLAAAIAGSVALATMAVVTTPAPTRAEETTGSAARAEGTGGFLAPYYTEADLTGDDQVTEADLDVLVAAIGTTATDSGWSAVAAADLDGDDVITLTDLAALAQRVMYDDGEFELIEASAVDMQKALNAGVLTSVELTQAYLDRITAYDGLQDATHTRALNSIITTGGQKALDAAAESDRLREANGGPRSMLDGIPIILKDNYDTLDMPTSAGHGSWETNQTETDAFMVDGLRDSGAVIMAKATLDEWAFGFASEYTTNQPVGTSKLVASPYNLARTAGGSSGGTGASISANLGAIGFGTDTGGSIRVPSSYNQLVGVRPTVGLASRDGIVPLALSQDTGGPMARSVTDAAIALDAVVGVDAADTVTAEQAGEVPESYTSYLDPNALQGKKFGYLTSMIPTNAATLRLFNQAVADLTARGATVEAITTTELNATLNEASGSSNEFKHDLNGYIATHLDDDVATRDLTSIIASGRLVPGRTSTYTSRNNVTETAYQTWMGTHTAAIANGEAVLTNMLDTRGWDALIYPSGNGYGTHSTNMRLSPNTGMPAVTVPMGQANASETIPGAGVNLELVGRNYSEGELLGIAYAYEQATRHRTTPALYPALDPAPAPRSVVEPASVVEPVETRAEGYTVTVSDPEVEIGDEVTVTVTADAASDVFTYGLDLSYDDDVLDFVGASGTDAMPFGSVDAGDGAVRIVGSELGTSPSTSGRTTLATLTFTARAQGSGAVSADVLDLVDTALETTTVDDVGTATVGVDRLAAPVATSPVMVKGLTRVGQTLTVVAPTWDLAGTATAYQWLRNGTPVAGATGPSFKVRPGDVGAAISVVATATLADHADGTSSAAPRSIARALTTTRVVGPAKPKAGKRPRITVQVAAPGVVPTGAVKVTYAGKGVGTSAFRLVGGKVSLTLPARKAGRYPLVVTYVPPAPYGASRATRTVVVKR